MANIKISDMTAAANASGTQEYEVNESGTTKKVTGAQISTYVRGQVTLGDLSVTASASELNLIDGSVENTVTNSKAVIYGASGQITANQLDLSTQGDLRLQDSSGGQYVALQAPATISSSYTLTMPSADGSADQVLTTNGSGVLSFADAGGGAYTLIADQAISSGTTQYDFTGLSSYKHLQVIVSHTTTGGGTQAGIIMGLSSGSAAQNPRDDSYNGMRHQMEVSGAHNVSNHSTSGIYIGSADANKPYYINCSIMNFNDSSERTSYHYNVSANQSFNLGFNGSGFIDYTEAYDYIRVNLANSDSNTGTILVLGVVA